MEFDFTAFELVMIGRLPHKRPFDRDSKADRAAVWEAVERVGSRAAGASQLQHALGW